jgi:isoleucyl-tRNA synthetase
MFSIDDYAALRLEKAVFPDKKLFAKPTILAWTTTPWTLPSNTALAVGPAIDYVVVNAMNRYTTEPISVLLAEALVTKHFPVKKDEPFEVVARLKGADLLGLTYHQLLPFVKPMHDPEKAFKVIAGDFVTTEDGTGIVHIAPTFGADDARVAKAAGIPAMLVPDENGNPVPLVDLQGRFVKEMAELAGMYVKDDYYNDGEAPEKGVDVLIAIRLKEEGKAFNVEKYVHSYPHCWRTDKSVLYYPLDSWFIRATSAKERMVQLNNTINWKPASTGTGRFGNWLENLNDWNLSRSRFWGIPIPIWSTEDGSHRICIGSVEELKAACEAAVKAGLMNENPLSDFDPKNMSKENYDTFDLHKNVVDKIILAAPDGKAMRREADLIDVWFDSGAMPYAQWHYPFENKELIENGGAFPADFIAEGVDQTRGWFYTLHAIATMCFDSVAYKTVVSNGLVLDKNGQKMSKRLGNAVDPFETLAKYGPDATRWYMITNAQPWDNLRFDVDGIVEVQRRFFGTLHNTYSFFALYANVDGFKYSEASIPLDQRPEIDRWIISRLNSLIKEVDEAYSSFEPTKAGRLIQDFVVDQLSNWYVRLCRKRFWRGDYEHDKIAAYQTLYTCLETVAKLASPIAPFYMDRLFRDLNLVSSKDQSSSVHLSEFPVVDYSGIDNELEQRMDIAQKVSSMVLGLRKKEKLRVRQPLQKIMIPILSEEFGRRLKVVESLILAEVNVKELEYLDASNTTLVKKIKANFKTLGPRFGKIMKEVAALIASLNQDEIAIIETQGYIDLTIDGQPLRIEKEDVEISSEDIPGWVVASDYGITVALDVNVSEELFAEGLAREFVNRIQNLRKDSGLEVTDRIRLQVLTTDKLNQALKSNLDYICAETLTNELNIVDSLTEGETVELIEGLTTKVLLSKISNS